MITCPDCKKKALNQIGVSERFVCLGCGTSYKLSKEAQKTSFLKGIKKLAETVNKQIP